MKSVAVFCGSNPGTKPEYMELARSLGRLLAEQHITVVFGGGRVGLMGALADAAMQAGGNVIGVMPHALVQREAAHRGLTQLHIVDSMHERKSMLSELADGFIALPGGIGTLEELFETWTWAQLGVHAKPIGLLDVAGYWQLLVQFLDQMGQEGFMRPYTRELLLTDDDAPRLLGRMQSHVAPQVMQWVSLRET
ncbi:MAG: TIGR00730 family Rossman fold protein [Phycisphaerae bacterium]|nr:TIGR00730 family Rossman fold protein [Gemmatimonadaceae bacterium]